MLCRSNVTCHAHENRAKYSSLMHFDRDSSVLILFKEEFVRKKLGTAQQLNNRFIDIRFIFHRDDIVRKSSFFSQWLKTYSFFFVLKINEDDDDDLDPVFVGSKRKHPSHQPANSRRPSVVQPPSRGPLQQPSSVAADPQSSSIQRQSNILKSAYRPANKPIATWTRNLALVACNFQRITAHFDLDGTGQVTTKELTKREVIEVSPPSQSQSTGQAGFIGEGFTKRGIYVSRQLLFQNSIFTHFWHECRPDSMAESMLSPIHLTLIWATRR